MEVLAPSSAGVGQRGVAQLVQGGPAGGGGEQFGGAAVGHLGLPGGARTRRWERGALDFPVWTAEQPGRVSVTVTITIQLAPLPVRDR